VKDFLASHKAPRFRLSYLILAIIAAAGCIISVVFDNQAFNNRQVPVGFVACLLASVGFLIAAATVVNRLVLETRSNSPSFIDQNKNAIIMLIIGACIGGAAAIAGQWLTRLLFK
jgi:drug/metabolite transporter (DMT)-like permease